MRIIRKRAIKELGLFSKSLSKDNKLFRILGQTLAHIKMTVDINLAIYQDKGMDMHLTQQTAHIIIIIP